jgi:hypothetical protein
MRGLRQSLLMPTVVLVACGGGGGGGGTTSATLGPVKKDEQTAPPILKGLNNPEDSQDRDKAASNSVSWSADHVTKTVTYVFPDGTENTVKLTVNPVEQNPALTRSASYPANWTSGDGSAVVPPLVMARSKNYGDGFVEVYENGAPEKPFLQSSLTALSITDPNAVVRASMGNAPAGTNVLADTPKDYDLRWGTPNPSGPGYAARYASGSWQMANNFSLWGNTLTNGYGRGAVIAKPDAEVMDAWNLGWTGQGVNVMVEDFLTDKHGVVTGLLAMRNAPGANFYGYRVDIYNSQVVFDQQLGRSPVSYTGTIKLGVVNSSVVSDLPNLTNSSNGWTDDQLLRARANFWDGMTVNRYKDTGKTGQLSNFLFYDAVIAKCAGNDRLRADQEPSNWYIGKDTAIQPRLLIVGALDQTGSVNNPASIAWYSNTAGADADIANRFLLASGTIPFSGSDVSINGTPLRSGYGTSYAAPRVAGMVAIVRSKFPNLSASQTASIMLDTARYDTLTCYKTLAGCDPAIYGKGEASLSRALAPVGKLR